MSTDLLSREGLGSGQGGVWAYISPSRLNCWLSCGLKFKLAYIDGLRLPTTPALFLGKICHSSLECYYRHRHLSVTLDTADVSRRMLESWAQAVDEEGIKFASVAEEQILQRQATDLVTTYLKQVSTDEPRPLAVEVAAEAPLIDPTTGEDLNVPLVGIMDLVLDGPSGPLIADFKTSGRSTEPLEVIHEVQLTSYAYLYRHMAARQEAGLEIRSLIKTKAPKIEIQAYPSRTDVHFKRLFALVRAYLDNLDTGRFCFRPGFGCGMCDFRNNHCPRWCG